jgi:hypothetical protein
VVGQVGTAAGRKTIRAVVTDTLSTLRTIAILLAVVGVVVALVAFVCGNSRSAAWIRARFKRLSVAVGGSGGGSAARAAAFIAAHRDGLAVIGAGVGLLILLIAGFTWGTVIAAVVVVAAWEAVVWYYSSRSDVAHTPTDTTPPAPAPPTATPPGADAASVAQ